MVFPWRLSDSKSPQVSRTLLSILAVFNNAIVWMVSKRQSTFKSSRPFNNPLVTVPKALSHHLSLMVFHWNFSDKKSPHLCRILLVILADINNAVVWMVSTRPLISMASSTCTNSLMSVPRAPIITGIAVTFIFHIFFSILLQARCTYPSFWFLSTLHCGQPGQQSPRFSKFSIFVNYYNVPSFIRDEMTRLYFKIPKEFCVSSFSMTDFWVVHFLFVRKVKFQFLAQLPVDNLTNPVVSSLILLLC